MDANAITYAMLDPALAHYYDGKQVQRRFAGETIARPVLTVRDSQMLRIPGLEQVSDASRLVRRCMRLTGVNRGLLVALLHLQNARDGQLPPSVRAEHFFFAQCRIDEAIRQYDTAVGYLRDALTFR
jgi:hypothetical protein